MEDDETTQRIRLSVVISCFNYRAFVGRAIDSVLRQIDERCELLVVDDGSTDGSWDVIQGYAIPKSFRVDNGGALRACLHGVAEAEAPFVLFLDADDELAPGSLARILPHLRPGVAKLQFPLTPIDAEGRVLGPASPPLQDGIVTAALRHEVLATGCYMSPPTSGNVFSRQLCDLLREVDYERWVDGVILFAAPFFGAVVNLSEPGGFYRLHGRNGSQSGGRPEAGRFAAEAQRFLVRHAHLRRILAAHGTETGLVDGEATFFFRERRFYQDLLEGRPLGLGTILALQRLVAGMNRPLSHKITVSLLFWLFAVLPRGRREALLAYRLGAGRRSAGGMLRALFQPRAAPLPA